MQVVVAQEETIPNRRDRRVKAYVERGQLTPESIMSYRQKGKKVLVVCNTVKKAQEIYRAVNKSSKAFLIHSRFLAEDRESKTKELVNAFEKESSTLAVSTQVCEVGLDISCDILLSELAPADALVQRMGRCARRGTEGEVHIFQVDSSRPYEEHLVTSTSKLIGRWDRSLISWNDERRLCDEVLDRYFKALLDDYEGRARILSDIMRAAFNQDRDSVERVVRDISSCEVSIHHDPHALSKKVFQLPTLSVDVGVMREFFRRNYPYIVYVDSGFGTLFCVRLVRVSFGRLVLVLWF
jgi:CRISPR-associated endonuclease/helicase Cas3